MIERTPGVKFSRAHFSQNRFAISIKPSPSYIDLSLDTRTHIPLLSGYSPLVLESLRQPSSFPSLSFPQYRPERLIPFSTRCSVRTETAVKGGEVNRWEAEIDARSQTRVTQGERRRSARPTDNPSLLFLPFITRFVRSVPFRSVSFRSVRAKWGSRWGEGKRANGWNELVGARRVSRGLLA